MSARPHFANPDLIRPKRKRNHVNTTPYGTGGGIWQAGAGPASDGSYIYAATGNGTTFDVNNWPPVDMGDSLLKLNPSTLAVLDYYAPSDVYDWPPPNGQGRCIQDEDFGSGGALVVPSDFKYNSMNVVINADKESKLYVVNQGNLGQFGNNIQTIQTPLPLRDSNQGYWGSPAYLKYTTGGTTYYMIYYSATDQDTGVAPLPINGYQLATSGSSGPIPSTYLSTSTEFCDKTPTPSVSSSGTTTGTGIVWAIENQNGNNPNPGNCADTTQLYAILHAFNAITLTELYSSIGVNATKYNGASSFLTPTVFQGRVYMGTTGTKFHVFGLCSSQTSGCMQ